MGWETTGLRGGDAASAFGDVYNLIVILLKAQLALHGVVVVCAGPRGGLFGRIVDMGAALAHRE